jgi:hypothetical protein
VRLYYSRCPTSGQIKGRSDLAAVGGDIQIGIGRQQEREPVDGSLSARRLTRPAAQAAWPPDGQASALAAFPED